MNRITQLDPATATGKTKQLFDTVQSKLGVVPNFVRVLGNSPAALEGYVNFSGALAGGTLGAKVREQIALAVAEGNLCSYCLSAHTFIGGKVGLTDKDIADVVTYVNNSFGNTGPVVTEAEVAAIKKKYADRKTPWTAAEYEKEGK